MTILSQLIQPICYKRILRDLRQLGRPYNPTWLVFWIITLGLTLFLLSGFTMEIPSKITIDSFELNLDAFTESRENLFVADTPNNFLTESYPQQDNWPD